MLASFCFFLFCDAVTLHMPTGARVRLCVHSALSASITITPCLTQALSVSIAEINELSTAILFVDKITDGDAAERVREGYVCTASHTHDQMIGPGLCTRKTHTPSHGDPQCSNPAVVGHRRHHASVQWCLQNTGHSSTLTNLVLSAAAWPPHPDPHPRPSFPFRFLGHR